MLFQMMFWRISNIAMQGFLALAIFMRLDFCIGGAEVVRNVRNKWPCRHAILGSCCHQTVDVSPPEILFHTHYHQKEVLQIELIVTSSAIDKMFEIFGPIFEQNL